MSLHIIEENSKNLDNWIENENFLGWDPHDALNSPLLNGLTGNNRLLGIIWVQLVKRNPINFRPVLGIKKDYNPKGMGLFLASYLRKYQRRQNPEYPEKIEFFADWLQENVSSEYSGACWGYNFDWPNRSFFAPKGTPTIVNTAFIALAFLDFYRILANEEALATARSACDFILNDLATINPKVDELCFSYTPIDKRFIHNANLMGAQLLAEVSAITGEALLAEHALAAAKYSASSQLPNGSWRYGEEKKEGWVDNFHTGFVLNALKKISESLSDDSFQAVMERGYSFWKDNFFLDDGTPKYYADKTYPTDIHSVAQAILTFLEYRTLDSTAKDSANQIALWAIENMQNSDGYFHYQHHRYYQNKIPYMRWSQAWMQRALTELIYVNEE